MISPCLVLQVLQNLNIIFNLCILTIFQLLFLQAHLRKKLFLIFKYILLLFKTS